MGFDYSQLQIEKDFSLSTEIDRLSSEGTSGFHIGIHSLMNVANRVKLSPQFLLNFSEYKIEAGLTSDEDINLTAENVFIRIPVDLHLELLKGKTSLYLLSGVEYAFNIADSVEEGAFNVKDAFWSGRIGVGIRKDFNRFSVSPELTFNKTFSDITEDKTLLINQVVTNLDNSIVGLNIKFQGLLSQ